MVKTNTDNFAFLRQPGNLSLDSELGSAIPATNRDAMQMAIDLGIRYLWVDSLCIVQDDDSSKRQFLNAMAAIYSKSYITSTGCLDGYKDYPMSKRIGVLYCRRSRAILVASTLSPSRWTVSCWRRQHMSGASDARVPFRLRLGRRLLAGR
jgi:hypothetical protein